MTCEVSCRFCTKVNAISVGTNHYDAMAFYQCWSCGGFSQVKIVQTSSDHIHPDCQRGKNPKELAVSLNE